MTKAESAKAIFDASTFWTEYHGNAIASGPMSSIGVMIDHVPHHEMAPTVMFMSGEVELAKADIEYLWGFVANPDEQDWLIW